VAEIKPAAIPCLIDGEEQVLRYIDQGNARDPAQSAWRASLGITVVSPMLPSAYSPPIFTLTAPGLGTLEVRTAWCSSGLLAYTVRGRGQTVPVPVPAPRRAEERDRLRRNAVQQYGPAVAAGVVTAGAVVAGRALWRHFWRVVIRRFALRGAVALSLAAADGPLPVGDLIAAGMAIMTVIDIINLWDELWREADRIAAEGA
jgi:hypothetical protein